MATNGVVLIPSDGLTTNLVVRVLGDARVEAGATFVVRFGFPRTALGQVDDNLYRWGPRVSPDLLADSDAPRWELRDPAL